MAIHNQKGSLAARPMIRSDIHHCPIRFSSGGGSPHLLTEDSRSGLKCLITVIAGPISASVRSRAVHTLLVLEIEETLRPWTKIKGGTHARWLTRALNAEILANCLVHRPRPISLLSLLYTAKTATKKRPVFSEHVWLAFSSVQ